MIRLRNNGTDGAQGADNSVPEPTQKKSDNKRASGPRMQSAVAEFYGRVAERRFDDVNRPVDGAELERVLDKARLNEITSRVRDSEVLAVTELPTAKVAPAKVYHALALQLSEDLKRSAVTPIDIDPAFESALEWATKLLTDVRSGQTFVFAGQLESSIDMLAKAGTYEPSIALAYELAKHGAVGGSEVLVSELDKIPVPVDVSEAFKAQLAAMVPVASAIAAKAAPASKAPLSDVAAVDALMGHDEAYIKAIRAARPSSAKNALPGADLNIRDQIASPTVLAELFGRRAAELNAQPASASTFEFAVTLARVIASNQVSSAVKRAAIAGVDTALRRAAAEASKSSTKPAYGSLAQALHGLVEVAKQAKTTAGAQILLEEIVSLPGRIFKETRDIRFALEMMSAGAASDPGVVLFGTVLDQASRDGLVDGALSQSTTGQVRGGHIALIGDRKRRQKELARLLSAEPNFCPSDSNASLLLAWPSDTPRPIDEEALRAERTRELTDGGVPTLLPLIEAAAPFEQIFGELLRIGATTRFTIGKDDTAIDPTVRQLLDGGLELKGRFQLFGNSRVETLRASPAIEALPLQMAEGGFTRADAIESIKRAIVSQNGALLNAIPRWLSPVTDADKKKGITKQYITLDMISEALLDKRSDNSGADVVRYNDNVVFAYRVVYQCLDALPDDIGKIQLLAQQLLRRTGLACVAPYAAMTPKENSDMLIGPRGAALPIENPQYLPLMSTLDLPPDFLEQLAKHPDLDKLPPRRIYEVVARALEDKTIKPEVLRTFVLTAITSRIPGTDDVRGADAWLTFNELSARGYDAAFGKTLLDELASKANIDEIYRAAATCASEGRLFDANDVVNALLARNDASSTAILIEACTGSPEFVAKLSDAARGTLVSKVIKSIESSNDASIFDMACPALSLLGGLKTRDAETDAAAKRIVSNAMVRVAKNPLEANALGPIIAAARSSGVDVAALANEILAKPPSGSASEIAAMRLEIGRLVTDSDAELLVKSVSKEKIPNAPFVAAFDVLAERDFSREGFETLARCAISWAGEQKAFSTVVKFHERLSQLGDQDRLSGFNAALTRVMKEEAAVWEAVPEARALAASSKIEELRPVILELAQGGEEATRRSAALAEQIVQSGPYAAELVPRVLAALRREVRSMRPSLDDVQVGLDVPQSASAVQASLRTNQEIVWNGAKFPLYAGERGHVRVPDMPAAKGTVAVVANVSRLARELDTAHPFILLMGPPGAGKTLDVKLLASLTGTPLLELDGGPERRTDEVAGTWKQDKTGMPVYERSDVLKIFEKGGIIVDDEGNTSPKQVLQQWGELASRFNKNVLMRTDTTERVKRSKHAKVVIIGNFLERDIPKALRQNAKLVYFNQLPLPDQVEIAASYAPSLDQDELEKIAMMQMSVENIAQYGLGSDHIVVSPRNLIKAAKRAETFRGAPENAAARAAREIYIDGVTEPKIKAQIEAEFERVFGIKAETLDEKASDIEIRQGYDSVVIGEANVRHGTLKPLEPSEVTTNNFGVDVPYVFGERETIEAHALAKAWQMGEGVLFTGPEESGTIALVEAVAALTGHEIDVKECTQDTTTAELFGEFSTRPTSNGGWETFHAPGYMTGLTEEPRVVVLRYVNRMKDSVRTSLHRALAERRIPGANGKLIDMDPNAHIVLTSEPGTFIGGALLNRLMQRAVTAKTPEEKLERLQEIGEKLGVRKKIIEAVMQFDDLWRAMVRNRVVAEWVQPHNLPDPGMTQQIAWVSDFATVLSGNSRLQGTLTEQLRETFIQGAISYYGLPDGLKLDANKKAQMSDSERLLGVLNALADGKFAEAKTIAGVP